VSEIHSSQRTKNYFLQVRNSVVYKLLGVAISFIAIPLMIRYLGNERYGIWSTMLSIFSWIVLFDVGIGNGLRNKLTESLAKGNIEDAKRYVSTGYIALGAISFFLFVVFIVCSQYINWQVVFNTNKIDLSELKTAVTLAGSFIIINFWLSLINQIINGLQKTSLVVFNQFLSNLLSLVFVAILYFFFQSSLTLLVLFYGFSLLFSNLLITFFVFKKYDFLFPTLKKFSKDCIKSITLLGAKFFIIQIAAIVIFTTDKILITQLFGPDQVTTYDVVFKLFSIITMAHNIIMSPLWSAYSDAFHRGELIWIRKTLHQQLKIFIVIVLCTLLLSVFSKQIIKIWIGKDFYVSSSLIYAMTIFVIVSTWNNVFSYLHNATNQQNVQIITAMIAMITNIPFAIILVKYYHFGVEGVVYGSIVALSFFALFGSLYTKKLFYGN